ncbi:MAG: nucleoside-diphosphate sugar epimerase/dehydratase [Hyphomicrobiaceae bacterium]
MSSDNVPIEQAPNWRGQLVGMARWPKRVLLLLSDFALLTLALWLSLCFRLNTIYVPPSTDMALVLAMAPAIGIVTFYGLGLYRLVTRYIGQKGTIRILLAVGLATLLWALAVLMSGVTGVPRSVVVLYGVLAALLVWASRQVVGWILKGLPNVRPASFDDDRKKVLIWGAGPPGVALLEALRRSGDSLPVGFLDDQPSLWGQSLSGIKVYKPEKLDKLISRDGVKEVLLAIPESHRRERRSIIARLELHAVRVKTLPSMEDIASGRVAVSDLRPIDVIDLLGRDPVPPDPRLLARNITGKSVMVTGAGGSIGSELTRQIVRQKPASLVLLEQSEVALYEIGTEITDLVDKLPLTERPQVISTLGSVLDGALLRDVIARHGVQTIYHAAAYKHVPIVEHNTAAGIMNNTFGTRTLAAVAREQRVERVVLISTDKAVRPTNIMGASKRLAELILQAHADDPGAVTVFTAVRFGNVLDSSGSVVRRFRKQIAEGGPVTVTHPDVIRYFMSIPEAAELVLQAGAMAAGGDVFSLDMGEPVKIDALARSMIRLMGLEVQDETAPDGDIAISYIGLRPGEKLYEELLIGGETIMTEHPRIVRSKEPHLSSAVLERELTLLEAALSPLDVSAVHKILLRTVEGYHPETRHLDREPGMPPISRTVH